MSDESPLLLQTLLEIKGDIGSLKSMTQTTLETLSKHILEDKEIKQDVEKLKLAAAQNTGARKALKIAGNVVGTVLGVVGGYLGAKHNL
jgi:hypothetical protein